MKTSFEWAKNILPERNKNSNKGSFGRLLMIVGSKEYRGAAHLAVESALRGGVGYLFFMGEEELCSELRMKYPEVIYKGISPLGEMKREELRNIADYSADFSAVAIGSGSGVSENLAVLIKAVCLKEGCPLLLDADALNSLAKYCRCASDMLKGAKREVVITPHPLEFSRISGLELSDIEVNREAVAREYSEKYGVTLLLKGSGTVVSGKGELYINTSGSSALAKAGSGDSLTGLLASFIASTSLAIPAAAALAAYIHGLAADRMAKIYSERGVLISDLPREMAKVLSDLEKA